MIRKIIEWDKKRKFGHKFKDFILITGANVAINLFIFFVSQEINLKVAVATSVISVWLFNRKNPEHYDRSL